MLLISKTEAIFQQIPAAAKDMATVEGYPSFPTYAPWNLSQLTLDTFDEGDAYLHLLNEARKEGCGELRCVPPHLWTVYNGTTDEVFVEISGRVQISLKPDEE